MRKLSYWAKTNPWKSRIIIILSHFILIFLAWYTGKELKGLGIQLPAYLFYAFILVFIVTAITYPAKKKKAASGNNYFYLRQKSRDFLLAITTFCMMVCLVNKKENTFYIAQPLFAGTSSMTLVKKAKPTAAEILASLACRDKSTLTSIEKQVLKKELKAQLKIYVAAKINGDKEEGGKAGLVILAIIGAIGLLLVVATLSCGIGCSGATGAAIAVLILGTAGVIWGLLAVLKAIHRGPKKKKEEIKESTGS